MSDTQDPVDAAAEILDDYVVQNSMVDMGNLYFAATTYKKAFERLHDAQSVRHAGAEEAAKAAAKAIVASELGEVFTPDEKYLAERFAVRGYSAALDSAEVRELVEALEFVTMPITNDNPTVEGLLQTMTIDRARAVEALSRFKKVRGV